MRLPFLQSQHTDHLVLGDQGQTQPGKTRRFQCGKTRILAYIADEDSLACADHFLEKGAVLHRDREAQAPFGILEATRRGHPQAVFFPEPECGRIIGDDRFQLLEQRCHQLFGLQVGSQCCGGVCKRLQLDGAFLCSLHQADVLQRQADLL